MAQSLNNYLKELSYRYYISKNSVESNKIDNSINTLSNNLKSYFGNKILETYLFGSYTRKTMLSRKYDSSSDVDIMIVFNHNTYGVQPGTYRNWLKDFADYKYSRSSVMKDFPTVVVEMQHIKFDLVPTIVQNNLWSGSTIKIPNSHNEWQVTDPNGFNETLVNANKKYGSVVKPIIRLLKAWNCNNDYPYTSYKLEQIIASMDFSCDNYETGFYYAIDHLPTNELSYMGCQKVTTLRNAKTWVKTYLDRGDIDKAKEWLHKILPY